MNSGKGNKVRIADLASIKMLRTCSNVMFGEAASSRRDPMERQL
jgi:hypothetical protein